MKAALIENFGKEVPIRIVDVPIPIPLDNEVLIAIKNASVNPVDWKIREGLLKGRYSFQFPLILGSDAAGVISQVGKNVRQFSVGEEVFVYCRKPLFQWGAYAEFLAVDSSFVAKKPKNLNFAESASIPLTALTAFQSLFNQGKLKKAEVVLIHAGAGGVGGMAIQLAKMAGAFVITTASKKNHDYVKKLGADLLIDYSKEDFAEKILQSYPQGIDLVFDTIGGEVCIKSFEVLKERGRLVSLREQKLTAPRQIQTFYVSVEPNGSELAQISELIERGVIKAPEIEVMKLEEIEKAFEKSKNQHVRGKIVLTI